MVFRVLVSVGVIMSIVIVKILGLTFTDFMIIYTGTQALFALSVYFIIKGVAGRIRIVFDWPYIKKILAFSIPVGLASAVGLLSVQLDKLVVGRMYTVDQLAIYANAAKELPVTMFATSLTAVLMPQLVLLLKAGRYKQAVSLWGNGVSLSYLIICFFAASFFVFAPEVITVLYSDKYIAGVDVFRVYCLVLLLRCTYFGIILNSLGKTRFILYSSMASLVLNMILSYLFYLIFGFIGPAIAAFVSILTIALVQIRWTSKSIGIPIRKIFLWKDMGVATTVCIATGIIFMLIKQVVPLEVYVGEILESVILAMIWMVIYILIMFKYIKKKWQSLNSPSYDLELEE